MGPRFLITNSDRVLRLRKNITEKQSNRKEQKQVDILSGCSQKETDNGNTNNFDQMFT